MFQINPKIPNFQPHSPNTHTVSLFFSSISVALLHILCSSQGSISPCLCFSISVYVFLYVFVSLSFFLSLHFFMEHVFLFLWPGMRKGLGQVIVSCSLPQCLKIPSSPESSVLQSLCSPNTLPQHPLITPLLILSHNPHRVSFQAPKGIFNPTTSTISVILFPMVLLGILSKMFLSPVGSLAVPRDSSRGHYQLSWWQPPACTLCLWEQCRIV